MAEKKHDRGTDYENWSHARLVDECRTLREGLHDLAQEVQKFRNGETIAMKKLVKPQPKPKSMLASDIDLWVKVIHDMMSRSDFGFKKYGTRLHPFNGRDALIDAYQEALDLCVYLRQAIYERDKK